MVEAIMFLGIGFLFAALCLLAIVPLIHARAVRLTKRRLEVETLATMTDRRVERDLLRAEFAMSMRRLEMNAEHVKAKNVGQAVELGQKRNAISQLEIELVGLRRRVRTAEEKLSSSTAAAQEAEHLLSIRDADLVKLAADHDEQSTLANAQKIEIVALKTQVEVLKNQLHGLDHELKEAEVFREVVRGDLTAATRSLAEERGRFENFHRRAAELIQRLVTQTAEEQLLDRQVQSELKSRLNEQSRLVSEKELELEQLRNEIEITHQAEADLHVAIIKIDDRASSAAQKLEVEKARLQAMLDRAHGECTRLTFELANLKQAAKQDLVAYGRECLAARA